MVFAPSDLGYKIIPSTKIWELHAMPLWREPPPESLSHYISPLRAHYSDTDAFGDSYGVIGLWGRLLVCLHGYYLVITWVYGQTLCMTVSWCLII